MALLKKDKVTKETQLHTNDWKARFESLKDENLDVKEESISNPLIDWTEGLEIVCIVEGMTENIELDESYGVCDVLELRQEDGTVYWTPASVLIFKYKDKKIEKGDMLRITCQGKTEGKNYTYYNFQIKKIYA